MTVVLLTPDAVAARLGLSKSTLSKLRVYGGGPPYIKLSAAVRYPEDALAEWISARSRHTSTSDAA